MDRVRVLVVEDSLTVRQRLCAVISGDPACELVGEASDGRRAIELCLELKPDVITMDMMLPVMSGLAATEYIMAYSPTPILIVSSSTNRGELFKTYEALRAGAVDVLEKPTGDEPDGAWEHRLLAAIRVVARVRVITHPRARMSARGLRGGPRTAWQEPAVGPEPTSAGYRVVAIGASTGGPAAIVDVLRALPREFVLPILFVLHINEPFGNAFAEWLDGQSIRRVAYAQDGASIADAAQRVLMAPPDSHLVARDGRVYLTRDPERHSCRPSVDVLFESVAREFGAASVACLLTGMGRDGAAGLLEVRRAGGLTIAQDEATSVVYGMPRVAVELGAVTRVLALGDIGPELVSIGARASESAS